MTTIGVFNVLVHLGSNPPLAAKPVTGYVIGLGVGLIVNYLGNRLWVFGGGSTRSRTTEIFVFVLTNAVAFAIPMVCLVVSRYVLGLDSALADNVAANVIGLVLATAIRWMAYQLVVFGPAGRSGASGGSA